ncbi:DNA glycosylase AlkZ-like family protein [Actinocorallia populi]|uniref:DNA glycosylase AlkZ-like family protein n=1 Tax=Actinocorallia populi TaxID=2079200 RepID=UPI000D096AEE|nr:crosslink repair DNA glycosylase YcaQ family protein [Actinocorallia populi]
MSIDVSRDRVLAYRVAAHGLDRTSADPAVLDLGVQNTPYGSARQALAARGTAEAGTALVWSVRGAPHLHRRADLGRLAAALWPLSDADATARITNPLIKEGAKLGLEAFRRTAEAFRRVLTGPMGKGEVSTAVSALVPESLTYFCQSCDAVHVSGGLFQHAGLFGGVEVRPEGRSTVLAPLPDPVPPPETAEGTAEYVRTFLRLLGPATPAEAARFLGTTATALKPAWPDGLAEVHVAGKRAWFPADSVDALLSAAPPPGLLRLLPPGDPYLQTRDRPMLVPEKAREKQVWRTLGSPGAVLLGGELAGTWRTRLQGKRLDLTVTAFEPLPEHLLAEEAERLAALRGAGEVRLLRE